MSARGAGLSLWPTLISSTRGFLIPVASAALGELNQNPQTCDVINQNSINSVIEDFGASGMHSIVVLDLERNFIFSLIFFIIVISLLGVQTLWTLCRHFKKRLFQDSLSG